MALFMYSDLATLPLISVTFLKEIIEYIMLTNTFEVNQSVGTFKFRMIISWGFQRTTSLTHLY